MHLHCVRHQHHRLNLIVYQLYQVHHHELIHQHYKPTSHLFVRDYLCKTCWTRTSI